MNFRRLVPFHSPGGVAENGTYYGVSHLGLARDQSGKVGLWIVDIVHAFQWDCHLGW